WYRPRHGRPPGSGWLKDYERRVPHTAADKEHLKRSGPRQQRCCPCRNQLPPVLRNRSFHRSGESARVSLLPADCADCEWPRQHSLQEVYSMASLEDGVAKEGTAVEDELSD